MERELIPICSDMVFLSISDDSKIVSIASIENETLITAVSVPVGVTLGAGDEVGSDERLGDGVGTTMHDDDENSETFPAEQNVHVDASGAE